MTKNAPGQFKLVSRDVEELLKYRTKPNIIIPIPKIILCIPQQSFFDFSIKTNCLV